MGWVTLPLSVGEREQGNIRLPCRKPSSNPITPWALGTPLGFPLGHTQGRKCTRNPNSQGAAASPSPPRLFLRSHRRGVGHRLPTHTLASCFASRAWYPHAGERVLAQSLFMSCWLWPCALSCVLAMGPRPCGMGPGAAGTAPTKTRGAGEGLQALFQACGG